MRHRDKPVSAYRYGVWGGHDGGDRGVFFLTVGLCNLDPPSFTREAIFGNFGKFAKNVCLHILCTSNPNAMPSRYTLYKFVDMDNTRDRRVAVKLPAYELARIDELAALFGVPRSMLLRGFIRHFTSLFFDDDGYPAKHAMEAADKFRRVYGTQTQNQDL